MAERASLPHDFLAPHIYPLAENLTPETLLDDEEPIERVPRGWIVKRRRPGKAVLVNPGIVLPDTEIRGLAVKMYAFEHHAQAIGLAYGEIRAAVERANFPLLMPLAVAGRGVIFPYVADVSRSWEDEASYSRLQQVLREGGVDPDALTLCLAEKGALSRLDTRGGEYFLNDPFEDTGMELSDAAKKFGL